MLSVDSSLDPLLKRPFSLHRWLGRDFQILYRTAGKATNILIKKKPGDIIDVMGPLGNGFPPAKTHDKIILVAGGVGLAPIFGLAETIKNKKPFFFLGAKTKQELLCMKELKSIGIKPVIATNDGSLGMKGTVVDALEDFLSRHSSLVTCHSLYACGPKPMLYNLSLLANKYKLKAYVALEENMACGIGACLGCVVNTKNGFKRVCKEGPVFPIDEIIW